MFSSILTIARYSLLEAVRGKIIWIVTALLILSVLLAMFISQTALTETRESQAVLMAGFLRLTSVLVMIFFVVSSMARDFQDKSIELLFAISIPRYQVFLGKFAGYSLLALTIGMLYATILFFYAEAAAVLIWSLSLYCELCIVALLSLIFILSLENVALSLMASIGIYSLMRFMPAIQSMGEGPLQEGVFNQLINGLLDLIGFFLPRLDHFAQSGWLQSASASGVDVLSFMIEFMLFVILFAAVGIIDLKRKAI
ncbi:MAG: hypothetical protein OEY29_08490 [Gammaproteobacteria bacterium]|nr:hypothetical protein [Gammaproteobacteria bacterium]